MIVPVSYFGSILLYTAVFLISAYASKISTSNTLLRIVVISFLPFLIAGFRYNVGWDYPSYSWGFDLFDPNTSILEMFKSYEMGDSIGIHVVYKLSKTLNSRFLFFAVSSMLGFVPAILYLLNDWDGEKNTLPLMIFLVGFSLFFTGLSAIKQGIAISFCLYSLRYVDKRKPFLFFLFVTIAFLFHASALVFLPVYLIWSNSAKISGWKKIAVIGGAFAVIIFLEQILTVVGGDRFEGYGTSTLITNNYLFYLMLFWLVVIFVYKKFLISLDPRNELLIVLYAVSVILMLLGFRDAFVKRIALYFSVTEIVLIPQLVYLFNKRSRVIASVLVGGYIILVCMRLNSGTVDSPAPIPYSFVFGDLQ